MTSSPAPDLDELERLFDSAVGADFLPVGWQAVFGYVPALIAELRAARAALARVGELEKALERYGCHLEACVHSWSSVHDPACTCGLRAVLEVAVTSSTEEGGL